MKLRKTSSLLISALAASTVLSLGAISAHAQSGITTSQPAQDFSMFATEDYESGNWFWGLLNNSELLTGATAVATDMSTPSIFYVGGPGYIATSSDSGVNWRITLQFNSLNESSDDEDGIQTDSTEPVSDARLEGLREYIRNGLEEQYEEAFVESIMEQISDEDLQSANNLEDIDVLEGLDLDMETDLSQIQITSDLGSAFVVSEFDSFIQRYTTLTSAGAESETAIRTASSSSAIWQFVTTPNVVYAVNSENIYYSIDQGNSWNIFFSSPSLESNILSFDTSADGSMVMIATSNSLMMTRNGGAEWVDLSHVFEGAAFKIDVPDTVGTPITVLTTEGLYFSQDLGLTWHSIIIANDANERILDVVPHDSGVYALSNQGLYHTSDYLFLHPISIGPVTSESIQQIIPTARNTSKLLVRTEGRIYTYDGGWKLQETSLMVTETGPLVLLNDGNSLAMMATPVGVWLAQDKAKIEMSPEYQALFETWSKEPSDDLITERALAAHYLDDWIERRWSLRSRIAWLLPSLTFDYQFNQQMQKRAYTTSNMVFGTLDSETYRYQAREIHQWQIMARWNIEIDKAFKLDVSSSNTTNRLRHRRNALVKQVQAMLKKRRAYQITLAIDFPHIEGLSKKDRKKHTRTMLNLQEIDAHLNYLTGGYFIPAIQESHKH